MQYSPELDPLLAKSAQGKTFRKAVDSSYLHRIQLRHFILFNILPFAGTIAALALLAYRPPGAVEIGLFLAMWLVTGIGVTVGFHRLFTHRSFKARPYVSAALAAMGSMGGLGSVISWVAMHRRHVAARSAPAGPRGESARPPVSTAASRAARSRSPWRCRSSGGTPAWCAPSSRRNGATAPRPRRTGPRARSRGPRGTAGERRAVSGPRARPTSA